MRWSVAIEPVTAMRIGGSLPSGDVRDTEDYRWVSVPLSGRAAYGCPMTAVETRVGTLSELEVSTTAGPLDDLVADAREVAKALAALQRQGRCTVRIPAQALTLVEDLGTYGD